MTKSAIFTFHCGFDTILLKKDPGKHVVISKVFQVCIVCIGDKLFVSSVSGGAQLVMERVGEEYRNRSHTQHCKNIEEKETMFAGHTVLFVMNVTPAIISNEYQDM